MQYHGVLMNYYLLGVLHVLTVASAFSTTSYDLHHNNNALVLLGCNRSVPFHSILFLKKNEENNRSITHGSSRRNVLQTNIASILCGAGSIMLGNSPTFADEIKNSYPGGNQIKSLKSMGGLPKKIRSLCRILDELQRDLMQERWDLVEAYPAQLRSYVPIFTAYTDTAFAGEDPAYKGLRIALRYEVGRFFASLERLKAAGSRKDLNASYIAYAEMALHFDRYLQVGNLYTYRDDTVSLEKYFAGIDNSQLVYSDPKKNPAEVRDLIILIYGPDKGRTGIMIGIYPDGSNNCIVKLDRSRSKSGIREIRIVPRLWAAKRLGEQDPDDVFLIPRKSGK